MQTETTDQVLNKPAEDWITIAEAARKIGIPMATLRPYVTSGLIVTRQAENQRGKYEVRWPIRFPGALRP